ncbi:Oxygen-insensitive NAD(P)H nitroreductase [Psychrobacter piechaudii]|uniref:Oxygen-insensitive NAD(P)H nitroreductase n=1 Tax=Psychrobacter piechaudii TaxID=1945521 RepID=A0A1R4GY37_9GAMM|nr:Oxygen-insensitive NAD(P)H nitroreductase [Psychrobacter piechaudii]
MWFVRKITIMPCPYSAFLFFVVYRVHRYNKLNEAHWMGKQVYLSMGALLLGAGLLGIDSVPMEGVDIQALYEEFGLNEKGYTTVGLVALGYRSDNDINATLPKSRLPKDVVFSKA